MLFKFDIFTFFMKKKEIKNCTFGIWIPISQRILKIILHFYHCNRNDVKNSRALLCFTFLLQSFMTPPSFNSTKVRFINIFITQNVAFFDDHIFKHELLQTNGSLFFFCEFKINYHGKCYGHRNNINTNLQ